MALATSYELGDRGSEKGTRESLDNTLRRTEVEQTPLFSLLGRGPKAQAMLTEFLVDDLDVPSFNGVVDGKALDFSDDFKDKTGGRARLSARVMQFEKTHSVSPQAQAVNVAGPNDLYGSFKTRSLLELKRDIESALGSDLESQIGTGLIGDKFAGLGTWTNPADTTEYSTTGRQKYRSLSGSRFDLSGASGVMTEDNLRNLLQNVYEGHGNATSYKLIAGPNVINEVADMTRVNNTSSRQLTQNVGDGVLRLSVTEYISDWGRVYLVPSLLLGMASGQPFGKDASGDPTDAQRNRGYLLPADNHVSLRFLEDIKAVDFEDVDGGGQRGMCRAMLTMTPTAGGKPLGSII
jgi:hypothetical protein